MPTSGTTGARVVPGRHVRVSALVVGTALGLNLLLVPPVHADTPGCVTRSEYYSVSVGMRMARVHRIFDTSGRQMWRIGSVQRRAYKICRVGEGVYARYRLRDGIWRMTSKWANAE